VGGAVCFLIPAFFGLAVAAAIVIIWWHSGPRIGWKRYSTLADLVRDLSQITGLTSMGDPAWFPSLDSVRFLGKVGEREAGVGFYTETVGSSSTTFTRFSVVAADMPPLRVTQETVFTKIAKAVGWKDEIEVGDEAFDRRFLLETRDPERARRALRGELQTEISRLFDHGVRELRLAGRDIVAIAETTSVEPAAYADVLRCLDLMARLLEPKKIVVRALGGERRAMVDRRGRTRCPYCRSEISGEEVDLVACEKCATVLHADCWRDHGGCPLLGCTGKQPERARA
jgi:hypothetical protein